MSTALELPLLGTDVLSDVESSALRMGLSRAHIVEAAARAAAALSRKLLENDLENAPVVGLIGNGVKGCVALHTLRLLHGFDCEVTAVLTGGEKEMRPETYAAAQLAEACQIRLLQPRSPLVRNALADADLVIDGLIGVGLDGAPQEPAATLIRLCNEVRAIALSLECPTGLDPDGGEPQVPTLKAKATLALGLPAQGLFGSLAWQFTGELWLCDVGYPPEALDENDLDPEGLFTQNELVRLR
ncbi:MAG: NAD(P)H-hydrate epimerase [Deltaproteobacteria bacterium]|nr:NAD(P)H-hydrate epimerase [Deltaproteobacteria bacterium]